MHDCVEFLQIGSHKILELYMYTEQEAHKIIREYILSFNSIQNGGFKYLVHCSLPMVMLNLCVPNFHILYTNSLPSRVFPVQVANSYVSCQFR